MMAKPVGASQAMATPVNSRALISTPMDVEKPAINSPTRCSANPSCQMVVRRE